MSNRIGRYEIRSRLGSGAFATVFEAFDPRLESSVAIKLLADNWIHEPDVRARFRQEAVLLRRVQTEHPAAPLLDVYDIDETDDGRPFFVMRMADRGSLADRTRPGQSWPASAILPVVDMLEQALSTLHQAGIVHRDVKPSNLMLTASPGGAVTGTDGQLVAPNERILLGDLGLAKDQLISGSALTIAGGTPRYMAPEQRDPAAPIDQRADLYAATVLVVDLLTGQPELPATEAEGPLSADARAVLLTGLAQDPADRFADAAAWAAGMREVLRSTEVDDRTDISPRRATATPSPVKAAPAPIETTSTKSADTLQRLLERPEVIAGALLALVMVLTVAAFALTRGGGAIIGPDSVAVDQQVVLTADTSPGETFVWSVGGRQISNEDLVLTPDRPGFIDVELTVTSADGSTQTSTQRITVSE